MLRASAATLHLPLLKQPNAPSPIAGSFIPHAFRFRNTPPQLSFGSRKPSSIASRCFLPCHIGYSRFDVDAVHSHIHNPVEEKPYTEVYDIVCWHYNHARDRYVEGINFVTRLYASYEVSLPVGFITFAQVLM